jgi:hypothetical protein
MRERHAHLIKSRPDTARRLVAELFHIAYRRTSDFCEDHHAAAYQTGYRYVSLRIEILKCRSSARLAFFGEISPREV